MTEFNEDFEVPEDASLQRSVPNHMATENAFYTAQLSSDDPVSDSFTIAEDLQMNGTNPSYEEALSRWSEIQEFTNREATVDIIQDPSIDIDTKTTVVRNYKDGLFNSNNLKDQYVQETASKDIPFTGEEDIPVSEQDVMAQELFLDKIEDNLNAADEVQQIKTAFGKQQNLSATTATAGLAMEVLSPVDLHAIRIARSAADLGVQVTNEDLFKEGGTLNTMVRAAVGPLLKDTAFAEKLIDIADFVSQPLDAEILDIPRNFLFSGSLAKKVADLYDQSTPEGKREILKTTLDSLEDIPGTDMQKWLAFQETIELGAQDPLAQAAGDIAGFLGASGAAAFFRNPVKGVKWYTTYDGSGLPGFTAGAKQPPFQGNIVDSTDTIATKTDDIVRPDHTPTGSDNVVNATDDVVDATVPVTDIPKVSIKNQVDPFLAKAGESYSTLQKKANEKVFDQPKELADKGNRVILLDPAKVDSQFPAIIKDNSFKEAKKILRNKSEDELRTLGKRFKLNVEGLKGPKLLDVVSDKMAHPNASAIAEGITPSARPESSGAVAEARQLLEGKSETQLRMIGNSLGMEVKDVPSKDLLSVVSNGMAERAARIENTPQFKQADKEFVAKKKVEVKEVKVDKQGNFVSAKPELEEVEEALPIRQKDIDDAKMMLKDSNDAVLRTMAKDNNIDVKGLSDSELFDAVAKGMADALTRTSRTRKVKRPVAGGATELTDIDYNVMRANGMEVIPVSADLATLMNASKNGYIKGVHSVPTIFDVASLTRVTRPSVNPNSPAGVMARANPVEAANRHIEAIQDATENTAMSMGTTKGELIADDVLPKLDIALEETFPNVAKHLVKQDEEFRQIIKDPGVNLLDNAGDVQRAEDITKFLKAFRESGIGQYNQANSTVHIGRNRAEGIATYGRNNNYGWTTSSDAEAAAKQLKELDPSSQTRVVERNGTHWVEQQWSKDFDHINRWMFNDHSMDSKVLGIPTGAITRSRLGSWIFPNTMKGDPDVAKVGFLAELKANRDEAAFFSLIRKEILDTPHKRELSKLMNETQETQRFFTPDELAIEFPGLKQKELESLAKSYYSYKRGADYAYELANKVHRDGLEGQGFQGIYDGDGVLLGYGKVLDEGAELPREVWDFSQSNSMPTPRDLDGLSVVKINEPIKVGDRIYNHAILRGEQRLAKLPTRTLPKVEGWIPRRNKEAWFIDFTPNKLTVDGKAVTGVALDEHVKTVGAGRTKEEADRFIEQLKSEFPEGTLKSREATENTGDASLQAYKLYRDTTNNIRKRGERLPTIHGFSRLEDPLEAFADTTRTLTRMKAWQPFKESFEKDFMKFADEFIPVVNGTKNFPSDVTALRQKPASGPEDLKRFKVAQRLLEQYKEMNYSQTFGDRVWRSTFNNIANVMEDIKFAGPQTADMLRTVGKQGNLPVRLTKSLASHLFIYMNPPKQWIVQPQQLLELNVISPTYASRSPTEIPSVIAAVVSRAPHMRGREGFGKAAYEAAKKASRMDPKDFDATVDAIYNSGLPQAVDLNQVLYGAWQQAGFQIDPSLARSTIDVTTNAVSAPGRIGKSVGYTPAEMANNIGTWLYARDRWQNNNPGKDWNTPDNIARITADSWDINHSMIGRAGAMPFQNGALGVVFQFMAVQQKGFMQLLSSKTLTPKEKVKLASARMVLYGAYGLPMGAVGLTYMDEVVDKFASDETKQAYNEMKGGISDALTNTSIDVWFADPDTKWEIVGDTFKGSLPGRSDIAMSKAMTPIPDNFPLYEMLVNLSGFTDNNKQNPRFPGPQALDSFTKAVTDIKSLWNADTIDSEEKLVLAARGLSETASLFNNYGKAVAMRQYNDKVTKYGTRYGASVTEGEIFFQKIGITTREEARMWDIIDLDKQRTQHISDVSNEVFERFVKMERLIGKPDYPIAVARLNEMIELSVEKQDIPEVKRNVEAKLDEEFKKGTIKQDLYRSLFQMHKNINNEKHKEMIRIFRESATRNEGDKRVVELWENSQLVEKE